ncbi:MAG: hypothetical protein WBC07_01455 [Methylotenera sp.]
MYSPEAGDNGMLDAGTSGEADCAVGGSTAGTQNAPGINVSGAPNAER